MMISDRGDDVDFIESQWTCNETKRNEIQRYAARNVSVSLIEIHNNIQIFRYKNAERISERYISVLEKES